MQAVLGFLMANGAELLLSILAVARIVVILTPNTVDNKVFGYLDDLFTFALNKSKSSKK